MKTTRLAFGLAMALPWLATTNGAQAQDIELYTYIPSGNEVRQQVMIVFDNSSSMLATTVNEDGSTVRTLGAFSPNIDYNEDLGKYMLGGSNRYKDDNAKPSLYYALADDIQYNSELPDLFDLDNISGLKNQRFEDYFNACESSYGALAQFGYYTGKVLMAYASGKGKNRINTWVQLDRRASGAGRGQDDVIDCLDDFDYRRSGNSGTHYATGLGDGYPLVDAVAVHKNGDKSSYFGAYTEEARALFDKQDAVVTLFTPNYLHYMAARAYIDEQIAQGRDPISELDPSVIEKLEQNNAISGGTLMESAKMVIKELVATNPGLDFGLAVFNDNGKKDNLLTDSGGRIVAEIQSLTDIENLSNNKVISIVDDLRAETYTPICETTYEVLRYLKGETPMFKDQNVKGLTPDADANALDGSNYDSPYVACQGMVNIIIITDGEPTIDTAANDEIAALTGGEPFSFAGYDFDFGSDGEKVRKKGDKTSYLPTLTKWMFDEETDLRPDLPGNQRARTFTIGFGLQQDEQSAADAVLTAAAENGGGKYKTANDATSLLNQLQDIFEDIYDDSSSFTSPSIAANNFDRTRSLDSVYYAMFHPLMAPRWRGNIKKLIIDDKGILRDASGKGAIDENGNIKGTARTYWSSAVDGDDSRAGGINEMLISKVGSRTVVTNKAPGLSAQPLTRDLLVEKAGSMDDLLLHLGLAVTETDPTLAAAQAETLVAETIAWAIGKDPDDDDEDLVTDDAREDVMGDPLHSKPLAISYGGSADNQDVRLVVGTNHGAVHMFDDNGSSVDENWVFYPYEELDTITKSRLNNGSVKSNKIYSMDGSPVAYIYDHNDDGNIDTQTDKVWLFMGQRRGGNAYYALDITDKASNPKFMWRIDDSSTGMTELAQSWSQPVITKVPGHDGPVLIFGGGYDDTFYDYTHTSKSDSGGVPSGKAIYIVDAATGALVWSATNAETTATNTYAPLTDSIPGKIATLDSDQDGITDRLYATDLGGNVWRVDMPSATPNDGTKPWTVHKFADLGVVSDADGNDVRIDRRLFTAPSVVQTIFNRTATITQRDESGNIVSQYTVQDRQPFDAIVVGSGNRAKPLTKGTLDMMFMLRDTNIVTQSWQGDAVPDAIRLNNLFDMTGRPFDDSSLSESQQAAIEVQLGDARGWYMDFSNDGEKSLSTPLVLNGTIYFTTFTPPVDSVLDDSDNVQSCVVPGMGRLYAVDMHRGKQVYDWWVSEIPERVPDTPVIHAGVDENGNSVIRIIAGDSGDTIVVDGEAVNKGSHEVGIGMNASRVYYFVGR
ncbi:PilC/PilY family type IV pilus protein [Gallaecimonas sp. GXIMD4217]|uniref:pilus assembly protein n=1 Tax=Gallaecimonas sp. GXIMD4217 TaxID=3131927 RepID=UPI00311AF446